MTAAFPERWPQPAERARTRPRLTPTQRACHCGTVFRPYRPNHIYCSQRCKWRAKNRRRRATPEGLAAHRQECRLYRIRERARARTERELAA